MNQKGNVLGISFDGLPISGIICEFLNTAQVLRRRGPEILLDLGYDIRLDTPRTIHLEAQYHKFPDWVSPVRVIGDAAPSEYTASIVQETRLDVLAGKSVSRSPHLQRLSAVLARVLVDSFTRHKVKILILENATLPENPLITEALYRAIHEYGVRNKLGRYVLWRDYDLMWSVDPYRYGQYPYPGVLRPRPSPFIHYAVLSDWMRRKMRKWAPGVPFEVLENCFFSLDLPRKPNGSLRRFYGIPADAIVIARCTRIIPEKCVERDIRLVATVQQRLTEKGDARKIFLVVTGPVREDPIEFRRLREIETNLRLTDQIVWTDGLLPFSPLVRRGYPESYFSVADLLAESNVSSFLTSFDYEGFGNPPGEAMAMGVPFVATTYELYNSVYGRKGAIAPLEPIDRFSSADEPLSEPFLNAFLRLLLDDDHRRRIIAHNLEVSRRYFSTQTLEMKLENLFQVQDRSLPLSTAAAD
jgi:glycosyltransferase involved in cell wall biosynthesis